MMASQDFPIMIHYMVTSSYNGVVRLFYVISENTISSKWEYFHKIVFQTLFPFSFHAQCVNVQTETQKKEAQQIWAYFNHVRQKK